jgi:DNA-binding NarL/FixJ family response regulator
MINLVVIEDNQGIRDSLSAFFQNDSRIKILLMCDRVEEFLEKRKKLTEQVHVIFLDLILPGMNGIQGCVAIKKENPEVSILISSVMEDGESIFQSLCAGAHGYITKESSLLEIRESIMLLSEGKSSMSPSIARKVIEHFHPERSVTQLVSNAEMRIVKGILDGKTYQQIADEHHISIDTVRQHIKNIYAKLEINSKGELIKMFYNKSLSI